ncbi:MAG: hypothetical protein IKC87_02795 [Clostridia bacterium]|nr:hypothetical protein [Clostridia bacterium]
MKRFSKAVALCLLLAVVLTAFGIFSTFAAPAEDTKEYGKVVYNMDSLKQGSISVSNGSTGPKLYKTDDGHWSVDYRDYATATPDSQAYYLANPTEAIYINHRYTEKTVENEDGTTTTVKEIVEGEEKNTDFFVIDFDISTKTSLLDGIYFHNRWYNNANGNAQQNYVQINGTDTDNLYLSTYQGSSYVAPVTKPGEWLNVTIVYDFSALKEDGFADTSKWAMYIYFDGIYAGTMPSISTSAVKWYFNRISFDEGTIQNGPECSTLFANFTYKKFEAGYDGPMSEGGILGVEGLTLHDIPDLKYTQENLPESEDDLWGTIERGAEKIDVYEFDDLDASLKDGDVVTLYRSISTPFVADVNANLTFKDANGTVITPGSYKSGDLIYIAPVHREDFSLGNVLVRTNSNYRLKNKTDKALTFTYKVQEGLTLTAKNKYNYILLDDVAYTATASFKVQSARYVFDLNGYTLTLSHTKRIETSTDSSHASLVFKNGTINDTGAEITLVSATGSVSFINCTVNFNGSAPFDQRGGIIVYQDSTVTGKRSLSSQKGSGTGKSTVIIDNSDISLTTSPITISNVSSSSQRQGSMNCFVKIWDSKVHATNTGAVVDADVYADATGTYGTDAETGEATFTPSSAARAKNDNNIKIEILGSDLLSTTAALSINASEFMAVKSTSKVDCHEQFSLVADVICHNSTVDAKYLVEQNASGYLSTLKYQDNYEYAVNLDLNYADLHLGAAEKGIVNKLSELPSSTCSITFGDEVSAPDAPTSGSESPFINHGAGATTDNDVITYLEDVVWCKRTLPGAPAFTCTKNYDTHAYILNGHEYEFEAYLGDPVGFDSIPVTLPDESSLLKYEWTYNIDGAYEAIITYKGNVKANLSVHNDLALNIFLPTDLGDGSYDYVYVEGNKFTVRDVNYNGVDYKAVTIPGIDPLSAAKDFTFKFRVKDENGTVADVTREISVLDYIENALKDESLGAKDKTLVASLLNYLVATAQYNGQTVSGELLALTELPEYTAIELTAPAAAEAKLTVKDLGVFKSATLKLDTRFVYEFAVRDDFSGDISVTYTVGGETVTDSYTVAGGDVIEVELLAYELTGDVTVTVGENSGAFNLAGYISIMPEVAKTEAYLALVEAIEIYAAAAADYVA